MIYHYAIDGESGDTHCWLDRSEACMVVPPIPGFTVPLRPVETVELPDDPLAAQFALDGGGSPLGIPLAELTDLDRVAALNEITGWAAEYYHLTGRHVDTLQLSATSPLLPLFREWAATRTWPVTLLDHSGKPIPA